jgi:LysM repeat protein
MKPHTLPVKRRPVPKGMFKRLSAVTGNRKQRVAATAHSDADFEDGSSKISRALTIIFLIHIVAIGMIFVHRNFLDGRPADEGTPVAKIPVAPTAERKDLPRIEKSDEVYYLSHGDNYKIIAAKLNVSEAALRELNGHADLTPGIKLKVPPQITAVPQRIIADEPPELTAIRPPRAVPVEDGLVDAEDVRGTPRATLVKPNLPLGSQPKATTKTAPKSAASGKTYTVQKGDSFWRIANRYKVDQNALMKANGITDARKLQPGMNLIIP